MVFTYDKIFRFCFAWLPYLFHRLSWKSLTWFPSWIFSNDFIIRTKIIRFQWRSESGKTFQSLQLMVGVFLRPSYFGDPPLNPATQKQPFFFLWPSMICPAFPNAVQKDLLAHIFDAISCRIRRTGGFMRISVKQRTWFFRNKTYFSVQDHPSGGSLHDITVGECWYGTSPLS